MTLRRYPQRQYGQRVKPIIKWSAANIGNEIYGGEAPVFPDILPGWLLERQWRATVRAFADEWKSLRTAGVISAGTACELVRYAATRNPCGLALAEYWGGSMERGRWYGGNRRGG